jgi:plastocyanin
MDGVTPGGFKLATQAYVQSNTITSGNLASNLATALQPYALTSALSVYATTTALNSAISAIPIYSLPTATTSILGGVKVDGTSITINNGVISGSNQYSLPIATTSVIGGVRPDGTTITINPATGVISGANTYVLPTATTSVKGGITVPAVATSGINNTSGAISLAQATTTQLGGVKVDGTTITINSGTGVISGANTYVLPTATTTVLGGVTVPAVANSGLTNTAGAIRLATATTNQLGGIKVDGVTITINGSGVISANITGAIVFQGGWSAATNTPTLSNASSAYNTNGFEFVTTAAGTVNFGAGNVTFAVGDNVIYDGTKWVKIPIGSSAGTVNSLLTVSDSGTGDIPTTTFNGSSPVTISYNSIGASPLAGSASLTTLGTIATGVWNGTLIGSTYGGTGVNNAGRTLTITGANRTLDQDVTNGSSPTFTATNFSGTAASLTAGNATLAASATSAGKSTNLAGGVANQVPYQTGADTTAFITAPTNTSTYLQWNGSAFVWATVATATSATNIAGGAANRIAVQTGAGATGFVVAPTATNTYLQWNGTAFAFAAVTGATGGTVTSVGGTGTVSGITLSGTVTSSGNLTLGGTLSLVSPPAIGSTTANTGAFTILTVNSGLTSGVTLSPTGSGTVTINPTTSGTINNMSIGVTTAAAGRFTTATLTSQAGTTNGTGSLYLNNVTSARIDFIASGVLAPTFTTKSVGTKIVLYPALGAAAADWAIGIDTGTTWFSVPAVSATYHWSFYGGTTKVADIDGTGAMSALSYASTASTGTAPFTVTSTTNVANLNASSVNGVTADKMYLQAATILAVTNNGTTAYRFDQYGVTDDPTIYATSGTTIAFELNVTGHPFLIRTSGGVNYNDGLVHVSTTGTVLTGAAAQGQVSGTLYWKIPAATTGAYQYICSIHSGMVGVITISPGTATNGPAFRAYIAVGQTILSNGAQQKVTFGTETFDTNANFATSRFTPTVEGYYQLNSTVRIAGPSSTGECMLILYKNGSEYARGSNQSGTEQGASFYSMQVSDIAYANGSSDYFEIYIQQTGGVSKDTTAGSNISYFSGSHIRGA